MDCLTFVYLAVKCKRQFRKDLNCHKSRRRPRLPFVPIYKDVTCCSPKVARGEELGLKGENFRKNSRGDTSDTLACVHFPLCDGCSLEESLTYPPCTEKVEKYFLKQNVRVTFHSDTPLHGWRSVARLAVRRDRKRRTKIGLFKEDSHSVVEIPKCQVHHPLINQALEKVKYVIEETGTSGYNEDLGDGQLRYIQMSVEHRSQTVQAAFVWNSPRFKEAGPTCKRFLRGLENTKWNFHSLWLNFNTTRGNRIFSFEQSSWLLYSGKPYAVESIGGVNIYFPPYAFRQSNMAMLKKLVSEISKYVDSKTRLLELYAGVGAIGIPVAYASGARLVGACELNGLSKEAYLRAVSALPASQRSSAEFFIGTAAAYRDKLKLCEVVIMDPPRSGLDYALAARLSTVRGKDILKRIIYVSCNFESLRRDLEIIQRNGIWKIRSAEAFMFFPGTDHWEILCVLDRNV